MYTQIWHVYVCACVRVYRYTILNQNNMDHWNKRTNIRLQKMKEYEEPHAKFLCPYIDLFEPTFYQITLYIPEKKKQKRKRRKSITRFMLVMSLLVCPRYLYNQIESQGQINLFLFIKTKKGKKLVVYFFPR